MVMFGFAAGSSVLLSDCPIISELSVLKFEAGTGPAGVAVSLKAVGKEAAIMVCPIILAAVPTHDSTAIEAASVRR